MILYIASIAFKSFTTMILRYNVPRLHRMRNLLEKKEAREAKKQETLEEVSNL